MVFFGQLNVTNGEIYLQKKAGKEVVSQSINRFSSNNSIFYKPDKMSTPGYSIIYGYQEYEDDSNLKHPVRYATAKLFTENSIQPSATTYTDSNGYFEFNIPISDNEVYVQIDCDSEAVSVSEPPFGSIWRTRIPNVGYALVSTEPKDLGTWYVGTLESEPWQAFDYVINAYQWFDKNTVGYKGSKVTVSLPDGDGPATSLTGVIKLPYKSTMKLRWDKYSLYHEYGHCVMFNIYGHCPFYCPNVCWPIEHYVFNETCEYFAFSEGWADFIECAVDNNPSALYRWNHCGMFYTEISSNNWHLGDEPPVGSCDAINMGAVIEGAVASILWDVNQSKGFPLIFDIVRNIKPKTINEFKGYLPNEIEIDKIYEIHGITSPTNPNKRPNTSSKPSGSKAGYAGTAYSYSTSATDPDKDTVKYTFDWGDETTLSQTSLVKSGTKASASHAWSAAGTYQVKAIATDSKGASSKTWSSELAVTIKANNPPNTPTSPSGLSLGIIKQSYKFSTSTTDPDKDKVKYTFDWGDGTTLSNTGLVNSGTPASAIHTWGKAGTYQVRVMATDSKGTTSEWSNSLNIIINAPPNTPSKPSGSVSGYAWVSYSYSTSAKDPDGDLVKYTFNWGDKTPATTTDPVNSGTPASATHAWSKAGTYQVKATATDSRGATSGLSSSLIVKIAANNLPNTPAIPSGGTTSGTVGTSYSYTTSAIDPNKDQVKYTFDWGDGNTDTTNLVNSGTSASASHSWSNAGTYQVKAMATDSKGASSAWSSSLTVTVTITTSQFKVTAGAYSENADLDQAVKNEFGNGYRVADWNEIKLYSNEIQSWADSIGMNHNDYYFVTWNGQGFWNGGNRHYFITRFDHVVDSGYQVHDQIDNNFITLGSWYGIQKRILAIRTTI